MPTDAQIAGGHKANLKNPNTSDESKERSKEILDKEFNGGDGTAMAQDPQGPARQANSVGSSQGRRQRSKEPRERCWRTEGVRLHHVYFTKANSRLRCADDAWHSTLKNPNVSDEAKESAKERLNQM